MLTCIFALHIRDWSRHLYAVLTCIFALQIHIRFFHFCIAKALRQESVLLLVRSLTRLKLGTRLLYMYLYISIIIIIISFFLLLFPF